MRCDTVHLQPVTHGPHTHDPSTLACAHPPPPPTAWWAFSTHEYSSSPPPLVGRACTQQFGNGAGVSLSSDPPLTLFLNPSPPPPTSPLHCHPPRNSPTPPPHCLPCSCGHGVCVPLLSTGVCQQPRGPSGMSPNRSLRQRGGFLLSEEAHRRQSLGPNSPGGRPPDLIALCLVCVRVWQASEGLARCDLPGRGISGDGVCGPIGLSQAHLALRGRWALTAITIRCGSCSPPVPTPLLTTPAVSKSHVCGHTAPHSQYCRQ